MNRPKTAHGLYLAKHRAYSRLAAKLGITSVQREVYRKLADQYLKKARHLRERALARNTQGSLS